MVVPAGTTRGCLLASLAALCPPLDSEVWLALLALLPGLLSALLSGEGLLVQPSVATVSQKLRVRSTTRERIKTSIATVSKVGCGVQRGWGGKRIEGVSHCQTLIVRGLKVCFSSAYNLRSNDFRAHGDRA